MVVMAGLRRLYIAFSCHFSVSGSLPSISFPLAAGESGDLGIFLEVQKGPGVYQSHPARCWPFTSQVFMERLRYRGSEQSPTAVGWTLG